MVKKTPSTPPRAPIVLPHDVAVALGLLTRLPMPIDTTAAMDRQSRAAWAYPLVGAGLGAAQGVVFALAIAVSLPVGVAAGLAIAVGIATTGALHEDGLADTADGFWGGWDRARRLEIMKDSRIGTYGVLALTVTVLLRWQAIAALSDPALVWPALIAAGALSRAAMVALWHVLPPARPGGLSDRVGTPGRATTGLAVLFGAGIGAVVLAPATLLTALGAVLVAVLWLGRAARTRIGGQTGDVLGATQQLADLASLIIAAAAART